MHEKPLSELLEELEQELHRLGYTEATLTFYRRRWRMLLQLSKERGEATFSEQLGMDFLETRFHILEKDRDTTLSQRDTQELRVIRMIGDFQLHHSILRRYYKHRDLLTDPYYLPLRDAFHQYCQDKGYSLVTIDHYMKQSTKLMDYLVSQEIRTCHTITLEHLHGYLRTWAGYTYKTVEQVICALRTFFRFLFDKGLVTTDFAANLPMIQSRKQTRIPSVWTKEELERLITAIDRESPKGKRDYAIILLACALGLRCTDIKHLKMDNFHWEEKQLVITQSKTKEPLVLPLIPEVGWAVIDYLRYGRPQVPSPFVFVRHLAPFLPFAEGDHLNQLIKHYMIQAHLPSGKKKRGMHSLRHTVASVLLEQNTPLTVISDILGHTDTDSTSVYLKVDLKKLQECPLEWLEETDHA